MKARILYLQLYMDSCSGTGSHVILFQNDYVIYHHFFNLNAELSDRFFH